MKIEKPKEFKLERKEEPVVTLPIWIRINEAGEMVIDDTPLPALPADDFFNQPLNPPYPHDLTNNPYWIEPDWTYRPDRIFPGSIWIAPTWEQPIGDNLFLTYTTSTALEHINEAGEIIYNSYDKHN